MTGNDATKPTSAAPLAKFFCCVELRVFQCSLTSETEAHEHVREGLGGREKVTHASGASFRRPCSPIPSPFGTCSSCHPLLSMQYWLLEARPLQLRVCQGSA